MYPDSVIRAIPHNTCWKDITKDPTHSKAGYLNEYGLKNWMGLEK